MDKEVISALRWLAKETEFVFAKEQLEDAANRLDALLAEVERLNAENEAMQSIARHAEELDEQLAAVTAERDAAVRHMKIIADTYRENVGDDGICGLCEYDAYHGIEGYANECPGFESNECFSWRGAGKEQKHG